MRPVWHQPGSSTWAQQKPLCPGLPPCWGDRSPCAAVSLQPQFPPRALLLFFSTCFPTLPQKLCSALSRSSFDISIESFGFIPISPLSLLAQPALLMLCSSRAALSCSPHFSLPTLQPFAFLSPRSHPPARCSRAHHVPSTQPTSHISWKTKPGSHSLKIYIAWVVRDGFHRLNNGTFGLFSAFGWPSLSPPLLPSMQS